MGSRTGFADGREQEGAPYRKSVLRDYAETILVCVIFVIFSRAFVFQQSKIPSGSMMDTLLVGDYIMVNRFLYAPATFDWEKSILPVRDVRRGDVVVFKYPDEAGDRLHQAGDRPARRHRGTAQRRAVHQRHLPGRTLRQGNLSHLRPRQELRPDRVKPGHYFCMGDHRNSSVRRPVWGQVDQELLKGRALLIWYSYEEEPNSHTRSASAQVRSWGSKAVHFFTKSRFSRCFTLIR